MKLTRDSVSKLTSRSLGLDEKDDEDQLDREPNQARERASNGNVALKYYSVSIDAANGH